MKFLIEYPNFKIDNISHSIEDTSVCPLVKSLNDTLPLTFNRFLIDSVSPDQPIVTFNIDKNSKVDLVSSNKS
ncbi:hypothetical protein WICMUC_000422 [Wickerhamomyces mucosus]|uniref:Uncharacterized protein n=1 Tax=Wickerhamomyces mucosus TaxID=1378264 RepID=A0A9P8TJ39_9ASCO|nr:hypothetical protein WICMUC_000422 [Wickerhamomyces mucosus]